MPNTTANTTMSRAARMIVNYYAYLIVDEPTDTQFLDYLRVDEELSALPYSKRCMIREIISNPPAAYTDAIDYLAAELSMLTSDVRRVLTDFLFAITENKGVI